LIEGPAEGRLRDSPLSSFPVDEFATALVPGVRPVFVVGVAVVGRGDGRHARQRLAVEFDHGPFGIDR
jgi:hypothetical protein